MFEVGDLVLVLNAGADSKMIGETVRVSRVAEFGNKGAYRVWLEGAHAPWTMDEPGYTNWLKLVESHRERAAKSDADYLPYYQAITGEP